MLSLYLIERLVGVNWFCCLWVSTGFYRGRATGPPRRKEEVGKGEKQEAGDPASHYKRAGVAHFLRCVVVCRGVLVPCMLST